MKVERKGALKIPNLGHNHPTNQNVCKSIDF